MKAIDILDKLEKNNRVKAYIVDGRFEFTEISMVYNPYVPTSKADVQTCGIDQAPLRIDAGQIVGVAGVHMIGKVKCLDPQLGVVVSLD